ncbi:MAG: transcriptional regulator [Elusimicrobia bacterium]|nr:transcriptional regulator [Elusimicrobiota bacterium]
MSDLPRYEDYLHQRLKDPEFATLYLNACLDTGDDGDFLMALRDVAKVYGGLRPLSGKAKLNREHLFRMLSKNGNPELRSLRQIVGALGFKLRLEQRSPA